MKHRHVCGHVTTRAEINIMAEATAEITEIGDKLASLTLKQAVDLSTYLKDKYGIEAAAGGVMMAGGGGGRAAPAAEKAEEKTTVDVGPQGAGGQKNQGIKR